MEKTTSNNDLTNFLDNNKIQYASDVEVSKISWLKAGGIFKKLIFPLNVQEIVDLLEFLKKIKKKYYVIGNLSNIILRDGVINTPILNLKKINQIEQIQNGKDFITLKVGSGTSIYKFASFVSYNLEISGAEGLIGIPGSIGGGIYMNASSYGSCISDYVKEVKVITSNLENKTLTKQQMDFSWRKTVLHEKNGYLIYEVLFEIPIKKKKKKNFITQKINEIKYHRFNYQEKKLPNLGSLFATKDLYKDIKQASIAFFLLYYLNLFITKFIRKFLNEKYLLLFRKKIVKIYSKFLGINKNHEYGLSERTINCLVNKDTKNSTNAIILIKNLEKKIKKSQKLENIILENIE